MSGLRVFSTGNHHVLAPQQDPNPYLLMIRQLSLRQQLPADGAAQEIDEARAALQHSSVASSTHMQPVNVYESVGSLCSATGILLLYWGTGEQSIDVGNRLAGLQRCVLQEAALLSIAGVSHSVLSCCGVICSLLLTQHSIKSLPASLRCSVAAAAGEVAVQQARAGVQSTSSADGGRTIAPILMYASSIFAAFSYCVLAAQSSAQLQDLLDALHASIVPTCLPEHKGCQQGLIDEQQAVLQRVIVPMLPQVLNRLRQVAPASASHPEPSQRPSTKNSWYERLWHNHVLQGLQMLQISKEQTSCSVTETVSEEFCRCVVKIASILSMAFHASSSSSAPNVSTLIAAILEELVRSEISPLVLAQHIIRPNLLFQLSQQQADSHTHPHHLPSSDADCIVRHAVRSHAPACLHSEQAELQERAGLHQQLTVYLLPANQFTGCWQSAACFMLTLMMPCIGQRQSRMRQYDSDTEFWKALMNDLLPVLQALALSNATARTSVEACMLIVQTAPDSEVKDQFCRCLAGVMCLHLPAGDAECFASLLAGISRYCESHVATRCCEMCCNMTRTGTSPAAQEQLVRALVAVVVHGRHECLQPVLELIALEVRSISSDSDRRKAMMHVRHGLTQCHDFRKKPECVRWLHSQLHSLQLSSL